MSRISCNVSSPKARSMLTIIVTGTPRFNVKYTEVIKVPHKDKIILLFFPISFLQSYSLGLNFFTKHGQLHVAVTRKVSVTKI